MDEIRPERAGDEPAVRDVIVQAFGRTDEADLVDLHRQRCEDRISLIAVRSSEIVGHILFTPAVATTERNDLRGMGLAPMAVHPASQGTGIGTELVTVGLSLVRAARHPFVVVLGHPAYYSRFGFVRASACGLTSEYPDVPDDAFMIRVFDEAAVANASGVVRYRPEFGSVA